MSRVIAVSSSSGITLSGSDNPVTVTKNGAVVVASGAALYGPGGTSWTIDNAGALSSKSDVGVQLGNSTGTGSVDTGSVTNETGGVTSGGDDGVYIDANTGASVTNSTGGSITSSIIGVQIRGVAGIVVNSGAVSGSIYGLYEAAGGSVTNQSGGSILSANGTAIRISAAGAVVNSGTITGGAVAVFLLSGSTLTNAGTIDANSASDTAVVFGGGVAGTSRLIVDPGATFRGTVAGDGVLELASQASAGTLTNLGTAFTNFGSLQFDGGAQWLVSGSTAAGAGELGSIAIGGFTLGDTIDLTGFVAATETFSDNTLVLNDAGAVNSTTLFIGGAFKTANFVTTDDKNGGTDVTFAIPSYHIISGSYSSGITLTNQAANPVSVLSTGTIAVAGGTALYGTGGGSNTWTINNSGSISGGGSGITLGKAGTTVSSGLVSNGSTIDGGIGVQIYGPGAVTNASGGSITGYAGGGIIITAGLGTVSNAGSLTGGAFGVHELAGGSVANQSGGAITSTYRFGVRIEGGAGTVSNLGIILGVAAGVMELSGGSVTNAAGEGITASSGVGVAVYGSLATVVNAGAISASTFGVRVDAGGSVTNSSTGTITGTQYGILSQFVPVSIVNAGLVQGSVGDFNQGPAGAALNNGGTIIGTSVGVYYQSVGSVTNQAGGNILSTNGTAILFRGSARGTIVNAGTIIGDATAVSVLEGSTLSNAGTIDAHSASGTAVVFTGGVAGTSRLIVDPGATFLGTVTGDGVLELASLASVGTLTNLGTAFTNFGSLQFDGGAQWLVSGSTATGAGKLGSIAIGGFAVGDTIDLTGFVAATETFSANTLVLNDAGAVNSTTLHIAGAFKTANFVTADDKHGGTDITFATLGSSYHIISGSYSSGITLTNQADNPVSVLSSGAIAVASGSALYGTGGASNSWTINNSGSISSASKLPTDGGIKLGNSGAPVVTGVITNESVGVISGNAFGIYIDGAAGLVTNQSGGVITGGATAAVLIQGGSGGVANNGSLLGAKYGVKEEAGGSVTNSASASIVGSAVAAVYIGGTLGTVVNHGTLLGGSNGVYELRGGSVTNLSGGTITGTASNGILIAGGFGTVVNNGTLISNYDGVYEQSGGSVTNNVSAHIIGTTSTGVLIRGGAGAIVNAGSLYGGKFGVQEMTGGSVTNQSGGVITGHGTAAVFITGGGGGIVNTGALLGTKYGIEETAGGSVTNQAGGSILATTGPAILMTAAGTVINLGTITGGATAVSVLEGSTLSNAGTINANSTSGTAVVFTGGVAGTSRLIVDPGATFLGTVTGDGVLELASLASVGTLTNLGTAFTNFGSLQFDGGAQWLVSGSTATGAGRLGSIAIGGFTLGDTIDLTGFVAATETFSANTLVLEDAGAVNSTTLHIAGAFKTTNFVTTDDKNGGTDITFAIPSYHTISGSYSSGITLTNQADNPVSVSTGTIAVASGTALYGTGGGSKSWTIDNSGSISTSSQQPSDGIQLGASGTHLATGLVTNEAGGLISGTKYCVGIYGTTGSVTNLSGGSITGNNSGVLISGGAGTVVNTGMISGTKYSILDLAGGSVTNMAGGVIAGGGINIRNGVGTVVNAGTVGAVTFLDTLSSNLLVVDPGAVFTGDIAGGTGAVELASAASTGNLGGFDGSTITNFGSLEFDPGAKWTISGNASAAGLGTIAIGGFTLGDTIDLTGFVAVSHTFDNVDDVLTLTDANSAHATLHIQGDFVTENFVTVSENGGTDVTVTATCYAAGTRIATPQGEVAVEDMRVGNLVLTVSGQTQPIVWIGHRHVDFRGHPNRQRVLPVRIAAHAFGQGRPKRDLLLSPDHLVFVDEVLIPIRHLVNGRSITQIERNTITYYHVELPRHDVLLAESLPAESYLDAGARGAFANHNGVVQLHPDFASPREDWAMLWEVRGYAPLVVVGEGLERIRRELCRQADMLGLGGRQAHQAGEAGCAIAA